MVDELLFKRMKEAQGSKSHRKLTEAFEKAQWRKVQQKTVIQRKKETHRQGGAKGSWQRPQKRQRPAKRGEY